ncbi:hypothetical protein KUTeg_019424 [Tegillarca granosa]|uniref:Protein kinase domain-containing protein n=1 Tax=Tegillarca granosa TaxID=220873 RepID=A0ABQ9EIG4_TEGGR|nr:hypothetical protein KUTeg_019424 [Tegillarca granosa]
MKAITLRRLSRASTSLPLPPMLARKVSIVNLADFVIDVEQIRPGNHEQQEYPATCCFDNKEVILKVLPKGSNTNFLQTNPSFVMAFEENDMLFCIYEKNDSLKDHINRCKEDGTTFQECYIWLTISNLAKYILKGSITPGTQISTSKILFGGNGEIIIKQDSDQNSGQDMMAQMGAAMYEAPEVLSQSEPDMSAFSWVIGCVIYEMLALEPAFYDRTGTNPFSVFMDITQGKLPPEPQNGSKGLKNLMFNCLKVDKNERINVEDIVSVAETQICQLSQ